MGCSAKLVDLPPLRENILLCREDCAAFGNSHLLYIGGEEKEKTEIKLCNSRAEVKLILPVQVFPEYGFIF